MNEAGHAVSPLRYGLDFGTSNSAIAVHRNGVTTLLPADPESATPGIAPSVLFMARDGATFIGQEAIREFVERNAGREIVRTRVNTGKIVWTHYGDEFVQFDADMNQPGRFFQALKSFLRDPSFEGTNVFGRSFTLEQLIALYLGVLKERADAVLGQDIRGVVLGRPVHFGTEPSLDVAAEKRLREAARLAGFDDVQFLYEPIGAALQYEASLAREALAFVFDFGGGTLDFSVVRLGPGRVRSDRRADILAVGGLLLGGNTLDEDVMERRLLEYFGTRAVARTLSGNSIAYPQWLIALLRSWHTIQLLNERGAIRFLREFRTLARHHREEVDALLSLVQHNYGWELFEEIERAKIALSSLMDSEIAFQRYAIRIREPLSRRAFERLIAPRLSATEDGIDRTLSDAGVSAADVQVVLRTGGSSLVPAVQALLERKFGAEKVFRQEVFTSIVGGLALAAARG